MTSGVALREVEQPYRPVLKAVNNRDDPDRGKTRSHWMRYGLKPSDALNATLTPHSGLCCGLTQRVESATSMRSNSSPESRTSRGAESMIPVPSGGQM